MLRLIGQREKYHMIFQSTAKQQNDTSGSVHTFRQLSQNNVTVLTLL